MRSNWLSRVMLIVPLMALAASAFAAPTPAPARAEDFPGRGVVWTGDHWNNRRNLFWTEREKDQGAVVFFGDSITEGWRTLDKDFPGLKTSNRGISGDNSRALLFRLQEDVLDLKPRAVSILIGINDLASGGAPADIASNIREIIAGIQKARPGTPIVLNKVMPFGNAKPGVPQNILALNRLIDAIAIGRPYLKVVDTYTLFAGPDGKPSLDEFPDTLHPNAKGYAKWKAAIEPAFAALKISSRN